MTERPPIGAIVISLAVLLFWVLQLAMLTGLSGSDAAGNGMAQGFAALELIILWILLAVLVLIAGVKAALPWPLVVPAVVMLPLSGFAAITALDLLSHPNSPPWFWPMEVAAVVPPLLVGFCLWALIAPVRQAAVAGIVWGGIFLASGTIWPLTQIREGVFAQEADERARWDAAFAGMPRDAPLWDWAPLLTTARGISEDAVLDIIRHLDRRQSDTEIMLERGDFPLRYLGRIDLTPTQKICDLARAMLRAQAEKLVLRKGEIKPYATIRLEVADAVAGMEWLVGYVCKCDDEAQAWETMANDYTNREFDVVRLRELRDPKELGRILRERPEQFSMLSPRSHLMAWLHYAQDKTLREQALSGARALDHRNDDAVDMLNGSEYAAWDLLIYLPELDLEATPSLCGTALREVHRELAQIYQPRSDDPRPYRELLERMGTGLPLPALIWLAVHGCDTAAQLDEAEGLVTSYQDSPERAAMLAALGGVHRKR